MDKESDSQQVVTTPTSLNSGQPGTAPHTQFWGVTSKNAKCDQWFVYSLHPIIERPALLVGMQHNPPNFLPPAFISTSEGRNTGGVMQRCNTCGVTICQRCYNEGKSDSKHDLITANVDWTIPKKDRRARRLGPRMPPGHALRSIEDEGEGKVNTYPSPSSSPAMKFDGHGLIRAPSRATSHVQTSNAADIPRSLANINAGGLIRDSIEHEHHRVSDSWQPTQDEASRAGTTSKRSFERADSEETIILGDNGPISNIGQHQAAATTPKHRFPKPKKPWILMTDLEERWHVDDTIKEERETNGPLAAVDMMEAVVILEAMSRNEPVPRCWEDWSIIKRTSIRF
ncbi:uncharacterized protein BCR38DRAFT_408281 [Pseudomassariella vexata]|uniref:Uncharacterized protein n=1 Tax=Pseudomassariella vexata TaxID=1141098 RepID=A0A1Y2E4P9_9PEZI|nr:uncharacterized protein BCR38DRAFT_408281 [Pseudomassariella vexata]ORY66334.1 hypothetical protein BCR38DRAFT_408281 [Pseudomassariella vexata]